MKSKRTLWILLILLVLAGLACLFVSVKSPSSTSLFAKLTNKKTDPELRKQQIRQALDEVVFRSQPEDLLAISVELEDIFPFMDWITKTTQATSLFPAITSMLLESHTLHQLKTGVYPIRLSRGLPDFAKETEQVKYIYATDASAHNTKNIPLAVTKIMEQVRQANPQAHILLATEFAVTDGFSNPIFFADEGSEDIKFSRTYIVLADEAHRLDIDILALDTSSFDFRADENQEDVFIKQGGWFVHADANSPTLQAIMQQYQESSPSWALDDFIGRSIFGVVFRNAEWATYIQAASPFYDKIIVYAGDGHMNDVILPNPLPELLNEPYVIFNFHAPGDDTGSKMETDKLHDHVDSLLDTPQEIEPQLDKLSEYLDATISEAFKTTFETTDETRPFYVKMGPIDFTKESLAEQKASRRYGNLTDRARPKDTSFTVYLDDL